MSLTQQKRALPPSVIVVPGIVVPVFLGFERFGKSIYDVGKPEPGEVEILLTGRISGRAERWSWVIWNGVQARLSEPLAGQVEQYRRCAKNEINLSVFFESDQDVQVWDGFAGSP